MTFSGALSDAKENTAVGNAVMEVCLDRVLLHARHGMLPAERTVGNEFQLDVSVSFSSAPYVDSDAGISSGVASKSVVADDLSGSICYAAVYAVVEKEMAVPSDTLEHVAARIGSAVLCQWPHVLAVRVAITKIAPPIPRFRGSARVVWRWKAAETV